MHRRPTTHHWPWNKPRRGKHRVNDSISKVVDRNIRVVDEYRHDVERGKGFQERVADWITRWAGSMLFVWIHVLWFGLWILLNIGLVGPEPFDPFPFGLLTTIVSLEAIFLSTFVLVSQNRQAELADRRSELDLQVNLLAEYEMTRVLTLVDSIAKKLGCEDCDDDELAELEEDVKPKELLEELDSRAKGPRGPNSDKRQGKR